MKEPFVSNPVVLLIGGPEAGKSNFLFRAWTHIDSGRGLLEKDGLPSDAEYLQSGAESQLCGEFAVHTSQEVHMVSTIPVRLRGNSQNHALLAAPDVNGEQINKIYRDRRWSDDWESLVADNTAYLFFVRANSPQTIAPLDWITCYRLYGSIPELTAATEPPDIGEKKSLEKTVETPTQVVLVDWLQFIVKAVHQKYSRPIRPRVAILVTAWDSVPSDFQSGPSEWIYENMPLLHQFCATNQDIFEFSFFGTSIFSGDPTNDPEFAKKLRETDPRELGDVWHSLGGQTEKCDDFTIPIAWALGWYPRL